MRIKCVKLQCPTCGNLDSCQLYPKTKNTKTIKKNHKKVLNSKLELSKKRIADDYE